MGTTQSGGVLEQQNPTNEGCKRGTGGPGIPCVPCDTRGKSGGGFTSILDCVKKPILSVSLGGGSINSESLNTSQSLSEQLPPKVLADVDLVKE